MACHPIRSVGKVTGSDLTISVELPNETNAASSPTAGPSSTRWLDSSNSLRNSASSSGWSLPALSRLLARFSLTVIGYGLAVGITGIGAPVRYGPTIFPTIGPLPIRFRQNISAAL